MKRKFDKKKSRNQNSDNVLNKKRVCQFSAANVEEIDYKDIKRLLPKNIIPAYDGMSFLI